MVHTITIHQPVGQFAAILTGLEFLLTAISAIALRAALRGIWLVTLHRSRRAHLSAASRARRSTLADFISFLMGVWLALSVALVESNLDSGVWISNVPPKSGPHCLAMNATGMPTFLVGSVSPTLRAGVELWVLAVTEQAGCDAFASVGTGIGTHVDVEGREKMEMMAPVCTNAVKLKGEKEGVGKRREGPPPPPTPSMSPPPGEGDDEEQGLPPRPPRPPPDGDRPGGRDPPGPPPDGDRPGGRGPPGPRPPGAAPPGSRPPVVPPPVLRQTDNTTDNDDTEDGISVHLNIIRIQPRIMTIQSGNSPYVELLPMDSHLIPSRDAHIQLQLLQQDTKPHVRGFSWEVPGICTSLGISSMRISLEGGSWTGLYSDEMRTTFVASELLCQAHEKEFPEVTGEGIVMLDEFTGINRALKCMNGDRGQELDTRCLHRLALSASSDGDDDRDGENNRNNNSTSGPQQLIYTTTVDRMWTFILGHNENSTSYACANATVKISYVFVTPEFVLNFKVNAARHAAMVGEIAFPEHPTLILLHYSVISGHCKRVVHVLGRAALSYAADAHWRNTTLSKLSVVDTLHAFLITTASIQLPLTDLDLTQAGLSEQWCKTRTAVNVTLLERDWRVWMLVCAVVVAAVLTGVALVFRGAFRGGAWIVGSAHWMLEQVERGEAKGYVRQPTQRHGPEISMEVVIKGFNGGGNAAGAGTVTGATAPKKQTDVRNSARKWLSNMQGLAKNLSSGGPPRVYELRTLPKDGQQRGAGASGGDGPTKEEVAHGNFDEKPYKEGMGRDEGEGEKRDRVKSDSTSGMLSNPSTSRARLSDATSNP